MYMRDLRDLRPAQTWADFSTVRVVFVASAGGFLEHANGKPRDADALSAAVWMHPELALVLCAVHSERS